MSTIKNQLSKRQLIFKDDFKHVSPFIFQTTAEILKYFLVTQEKGLTQEQIKFGLEKYGPNDIASQELKWWSILFRQFTSPFIYLLLGAAVLATILGESLDGVMIFLFVVVNALLSFFQEYRSEQTLRLLKKYTVHKVEVMREGNLVSIPSPNLVPGDIVKLKAGDIIPADVRFLELKNLLVDESILTGESQPTIKTNEPITAEVSEINQFENLGWSGTSLVTGGATAVVIATGRQTQLGQITHLTATTTRVSSFEKGLNHFSQFILRLIFITLIFVFLANLLIKGNRVDIGDLILFSIALAVSVIPEALPTVTTFSLSRGALKLAKNKVVVKRLSAIEDLGSIEILCTDKTGTLTENRLSVAEIYAEDADKTLMMAALGSTNIQSIRSGQNSFADAIWEKLPEQQKQKMANFKLVKEIPFDPERRCASSLFQAASEQILIVKGAPEQILPVADLPVGKMADLRKWLTQQGEVGKRVLAVAFKKFPEIRNGDYTQKDETTSLKFLGIISFTDPIKITAAAAIAKAEKLGVQIKIITGDAKEVAGAVAQKVGLVKSLTDVITQDQLDSLESSELHETVNKFSVFARITPIQKYRIIELLQEKHEVGFLGEGINDAPALKIANVALVVDHATDIAREAADIVLLKKSLRVIVDGIEEGRSVFANTMKYIKATLSSNFGNFYAVAIASLMIDFLPMLPLQLLLLNLLSDLPMISIATDNVDEAELRRPRSYDIKEIVLLSTILGIVSSVFDFIFFALFVKSGPQILHTNWFIASVLTELVLLFSIRTHGLFFKGKAPSWLVILLTGSAFVMAIFLPLFSLGRNLFSFAAPSWAALTLILVLVGIYFILTEVVKLAYYRIFSPKIEVASKA